MDNNENNEMSSQFYLDAMNQLKQLNEQREIREISMKKENRKLKLELISCFGLIMNIESMAFDREIDYDIGNLIDVLRMNLEESVENLINLKLVQTA